MTVSRLSVSAKRAARRICLVFLCVATTTPPTALAAVEGPATGNSHIRRLTLPVAIEWALAASPQLASARAAARGAEGSAAQANYRPNPELRLEMENLAGTGPYRAMEGDVYTLSASQKIEVGSKRSHRTHAARFEVEVEQVRIAQGRLELVRQVTSAYTRVIAAQEQLKLAREHRELAQALLAEVDSRVKAARAPTLQLSKAQIADARADLAEKEQERELQHAQHVLASFWFGGHERYEYHAASFFELDEPMTEADLQAQLRHHPHVRQWESEQQKRQALLRLAKAETLPDPIVEVGVRQFADTGDQAFVLGVSMELPIFNRNGGSVSRARALLSRSYSEEKAATLSLTAEGLQALEEMINAYQRANTLSAVIVPAAERAFDVAREGYAAGRFPYIEVLDAERTLFDTKQDRIEALESYHLAKARVDFVMASYAKL